MIKEIKTDKDRMEVGNSILRELGASKKTGFFDWQWMEDDEYTIFEFYWDYIDTDFIWYLMDYIKLNEQYSPILTGGSHDNSNQKITYRPNGGLGRTVTDRIAIPQIKLSVKVPNNR